MATRLSVAAVLVIVTLALGVTGFGFSVAEATQPQQPNTQAMMKMHEQMMAEMKAGDAKLDALVKDMNDAKGDAKLNAIAAVVNELVQQHKTMHGRMGQMHQQMMGGRGKMMRQ